MEMQCEAAKMTWDTLQEKARDIGVALVPAGTTERHGHRVGCRPGLRSELSTGGRGRPLPHQRWYP